MILAQSWIFNGLNFEVKVNLFYGNLKYPYAKTSEEDNLLFTQADNPSHHESKYTSGDKNMAYNNFIICTIVGTNLNWT